MISIFHHCELAIHPSSLRNLHPNPLKPRLPEFMDCGDPLDVCSCSKAPMFAELCGCCLTNDGNDLTSNKTVCLSLG